MKYQGIGVIHSTGVEERDAIREQIRASMRAEEKAVKDMFCELHDEIVMLMGKRKCISVAEIVNGIEGLEACNMGGLLSMTCGCGRNHWNGFTVKRGKIPQYTFPDDDGKPDLTATPIVTYKTATYLYR